jgi:hypothetical protein
MSTAILLNTTAFGTRWFTAGTHFDDVAQASAIASIQGQGGIFMPATNPVVAAQAARAQDWRISKGRNETEITALMLAAGLATLDVMPAPQAALLNASQAEVQIATLAGAGSIVGAYYSPGAASAPAAGSNSMAVVFNLYDQTGTLVGQLASGTLNSANPMVKWSRFSFAAITNGFFQDC